MKYLIAVIMFALTGCAQLQEWTGIEAVKHKNKDGMEVGCDAPDSQGIQHCSVMDENGNVTTWTVNTNKGAK